MLFAALLALATGCGSGGTYVAPKPTAVASIDPGQATLTLESLANAVRRGDADAARTFGSDAATGDRLAAMAENVTTIGLKDVALTYLAENGGGTFDGSWGATVEVAWRVDGFDDRRAATEVDVDFADGGQKVSGVGDAQQATPLWLTGPVTVRRAPGAMVIATTPAKVADTLIAEARAAVARDRQVLGGDPHLVIEAPRSVQELQRALGAQAPAYADIAGVTAPVDGNRVAGTPVHVFINPVVFHTMKPIAAQVVVTHESVHAVTNAPLSGSAPLWLVEGFADYVALGSGPAARLPLSRTAGQISAQVRKHGAPRALPADTDFSGNGGTDLGPTYEAAWLACVTIADHAGQDALIRLYRDVLGGTPVEEALPQDTGLSLASLTDAWRSRLEATASSLS